MSFFAFFIFKQEKQLSGYLSYCECGYKKCLFKQIWLMAYFEKLASLEFYTKLILVGFAASMLR